MTAFDTIDNGFNADAWDGHQAAHQRLFDIIARTRPANPIVLSGDIHYAWGADLLQDFDPPDSPSLAAEFVYTSPSSTFLDLDPRPVDLITHLSRPDDPHTRYGNGLFQGYRICDVNRDRWQTNYRAEGDLARLPDRDDPLALTPFADCPVETDAVLEIKAGFAEPDGDHRTDTQFPRFLV